MLKFDDETRNGSLLTSSNTRLHVIEDGYSKITCGASNIYYEDLKLDFYYHQSKQGKIEYSYVCLWFMNFFPQQIDYGCF